MNWQQTQLKYVARFAYGDSLPSKDEERKGIIKVFGSNGPFEFFSKANTKAPVIVIGRKGSYGKVNWSDEPVFASDTTFFVDSTTTKHHLRWLFYVFQTLKLDEGSNETAVPGLNRDNAYQNTILVPSLEEQRAIADYLDRATATIDALITAKTHLLDLLAEKRRALITQAVTRGLNPDVPLKDSGLEWLGKIPAHWQVVHLRRVLRSMDYGISESVDIQGKIAVLRMGDIADGEIIYDHVGFVDEVNQDLLLSPGDLLFNRTNSLALVGKVGIFRETLPFPVSFASYLVRLRCGDLILPEFLNYQLNSEPMLVWARSEALPAIGQANLNPNRYSYLPIPLPPIQEQFSITKYLKSATQSIDKLSSVAEDTINLLHERRSALIAAAVTGQIRIKE